MIDTFIADWGSPARVLLKTPLGLSGFDENNRIDFQRREFVE
jgi:hypothetical protein